MPLDDRLDDETEEFGSSSERALNDVALSMGFSMMVLLFVVVSSMTALQNVVVNLPETASGTAEPSPEVATHRVIVSMVADEGANLSALYADDEPLEVQSLEESISARYAATLPTKDRVILEIRADGRLSHQDVTETVFRLNDAFRSLGGTSRQVDVQYVSEAVDDT